MSQNAAIHYRLREAPEHGGLAVKIACMYRQPDTSWLLPEHTTTCLDEVTCWDCHVVLPTMAGDVARTLRSVKDLGNA